jgi:hypothetical protein
MTQSDRVTVYRECAPVVDAKYEAESERTLGEVLIAALAEAADVDVTAFPPLDGTIDLEAVGRLFDTPERGTASGLLLRFEFENWKAYIRGDGYIRICDRMKSVAPTPVFESPLVELSTS